MSERTPLAPSSPVRRAWVAGAALVLAGLGTASLAAQTSRPPVTVASVDLTRYAGTWYEVARFPNRFQRRCLGDVTASYRLLENGRVEVVNRCRTADGPIEAKGVARVVDGSGNAKLKVRFAPAFLSFLPMVWGDYWVLDLAADYSTAVVGSPDRAYLWLLTRSPDVDPATFDRMVEAARTQGFDMSRLQRTGR